MQSIDNENENDNAEAIDVAQLREIFPDMVRALGGITVTKSMALLNVPVLLTATLGTMNTLLPLVAAWLPLKNVLIKLLDI